MPLITSELIYSIGYILTHRTINAGENFYSEFICIF